MRSVLILAAVLICVTAFPAQTKPAAKRTPPPVTARYVAAAGHVSDLTYENERLSFSITFPDGWAIRDKDFDIAMLKEGVDLRLKPPDNLTTPDKTKMAQNLRNVEILVTATRSKFDSWQNAILRVSVEDLQAFPQIKDSVDYLDAMRATFKTMKLPKDFRYSDTQAETLGTRQFAFLDTSTYAGKKRIYAMVRGHFAILFTLSYNSDEDLETMRRTLSIANFKLV